MYCIRQYCEKSSTRALDPLPSSVASCWGFPKAEEVITGGQARKGGHIFFTEELKNGIASQVWLQ